MNDDDYLDSIWHGMWRQTMGQDPIWPREAYFEVGEDEIKFTDPTRKPQGVIELVQGPDGVWQMDVPETDLMRAARLMAYWKAGMRVQRPTTSLSMLNIST